MQTSSVLLSKVKTRLGGNPANRLPIGAEDTFAGVVDLDRNESDYLG